MRRCRERRAGFSLVEVVLGSVILTIAISGMLAVVVSFTRLARVNRESGIAVQAAREMLERLQDANFPDVFALHNADPADDPGGAGSAPGRNFVVAGLRPRADDADGMVGEILFPTVGNTLREDLADTPWSMPRDLNADGLVDGADHSDDYRILPVRVRLSWRGAAGNRSLVVNTLLTSR